MVRTGNVLGLNSAGFSTFPCALRQSLLVSSRGLGPRFKEVFWFLFRG